MLPKSLALAALACCSVGCATVTRNLVPVAPSSMSLKVPAQQQMLSEAARDAVEQAVTRLPTTELTGKVARVQIAGVFPPSAEELLGYLKTLVEAELVKKGLRVEPNPLPHQYISVGPPAPLPQPDVVVGVAVDWAGFDVQSRLERKGPAILMGVGSGMMAMGLVLFGVSFTGYSLGALSVVGGVLAGVGLICLLAGIIWYQVPPESYQTTARVKVSVHTQPAMANVPGYRAFGEASRQVTYDFSEAGGNRPVINIPAQ